MARHALFVTSIPSTANRDLFDIELTEQTYADGISAVSFELSDGTRCRSVDSLPVFTADISEIPLHSSEAAWYRIGEDMSGKSIVVERPDNSAVFVYKYVTNTVCESSSQLCCTLGETGFSSIFSPVYILSDLFPSPGYTANNSVLMNILPSFSSK